MEGKRSIRKTAGPGEIWLLDGREMLLALWLWSARKELRLSPHRAGKKGDVVSRVETMHMLPPDANDEKHSQLICRRCSLDMSNK